jgi:NIPSNAP
VTDAAVTDAAVTDAAVTDDSAVYLHVAIQLVRGKHRVFAAAMAEMAPVLENQGWRLVGAFTPGIGRLGAVYHLWRVPSADSAVAALAAVRAHPDAARWHDTFAESVADEALQLVRPMPYSRTP